MREKAEARIGEIRAPQNRATPGMAAQGQNARPGPGSQAPQVIEALSREAPPQNLDAEQAVLAAVLQAPAVLDELAGLIEPGDFYSPGHEAIYRAMIRLRAEGRAVDLVIVADAVKGSRPVDDLGGSFYLADLTDLVSSPQAAPAHARIVREHSMRRQIEAIGLAVATKARQPTRDVGTLAEWAAKSLTDIAGCSKAEASPRLVAVNAADLLVLDLPPRAYVLRPILPAQGLAMLHAPRGLGKTWLSLSIAYSVAAGQSVFGRWQAEQPRRVLFLDGEMPAVALKERLASIAAGCDGEPPDPGYLRLVSPDLQVEPMPNLATQEGQAAVAPLLEGIELLILDNLASLAHAGKENESESWLPVQSWLLALRRVGKSVLLVHHSGKSGGQRGTSAREDCLDTVLGLRRPDDYTAEQGARFEVHMEKARGVYGPGAKPFEAALVLDGNGAATWATRAIDEAETARILAMHEDGMKPGEIARELGIHRATVYRRLKESKP